MCGLIPGDWAGTVRTCCYSLRQAERLREAGSWTRVGLDLAKTPRRPGISVVQTRS